MDTVAKRPGDLWENGVGGRVRTLSKWEEKRVEGEKAEAAGVHPALDEFGGELNQRNWIRSLERIRTTETKGLISLLGDGKSKSS